MQSPFKSLIFASTEHHSRYVHRRTRTSPESHHVIDLLCVVSEDFSEFLGVDFEIIFGVQFGPTDLEDFGFVGFGGSDF